jgi:hypothetical protein
MQTEPPASPAPIRIPAGAHDGDARLPAEAAAAAAAAAAPTPEQVAAPTNGSLAARLQAKLAKIQSGTDDFEVPGWDGELVLRAKVVRDRKQLAAGLTNEQLLLEATEQVLYRDDDGELRDCGGWLGVGRLMGLQGDFTLGAVVRAVLDNPLRLDGFAEKLISWMMGRQSAVERVLGE